MTIDSKSKYKLRRFVEELEQIRAPHTELISVYIPAGYDLNKIIQHLQEEQSTARNIKSKTTQNNVINALEKMIRHLRLFKKTPDNGMAIFSGNLLAKEGKQDYQVWSIEPPVPISTRLYRCDQTFVIDILKQQTEHKETYGLVVMDRREATLGLLKGSTIIELTHLTSGVPGKMKAGGQCLHPDTLIIADNGEILKIKDSHNPYVLKSADFQNMTLKDTPITDKWDTKKECVYKIITRYPRIEIIASKDHTFFVSGGQIKEKPAELLEEGDFLIMPEKIDIEGAIQTLDSKKYYNSFIINKEGQELLKKKREEKVLLQRELAKKINLKQTTISYYEIGKINAGKEPLEKLCKELGIDFEEFIEKYTNQKNHQGTKVNLPTELNEDFAQFLGYYLGDGSSEIDRITFFEQNKQVALDYQKKFNQFFNINSSYKFRESKHYYQIRFTSRPLVRLIKNEFPELKKAIDSEMPKKVMLSPDKILAAFLKGLYDAEGYISNNKVGMGLNNKYLVQQIQLSLLRLGIICSQSEYNAKANPYSKNYRYSIEISDIESLKKFSELINFRSEIKKEKLSKALIKRNDMNRVRQILLPGSEIRKILENYNMKVSDFPKVSNFFNNKRNISKTYFKKSVLSYINNPELYEKLSKISNYPFIPVKIKKIEKIEQPSELIDISVKNQNFIANGVIVHNSSNRFRRIIEQMAHEFYKRIGEVVNKEFASQENMKGILIGGPGNTKIEFLDGDYMFTELKNKVTAAKDLSYTGSFGLNELVEKSQDVLAQEIITKEKQIINNFLEMLAKQPEKTAYGLAEVKIALERGAVDLLIISESMDTKTAEELEKLGEESGAKTEFISTETNEGMQLKNLGGVGAILRYQIN